MRWERAIIASVLALGCRRSSSGSAPSGTASSTSSAPGVIISDSQRHEALRDDSRLMLERHCGGCHIRDYPTAIPGALAVFDLREPDWSAGMSDAQLRSALWRLGEPLPPDGSPNDVSPEERARFQNYVETEWARRARLEEGGAR